MGGAHIMKRIPRIKFPQRHPKPSSGSTQQNSQHMKASATDNVPRTFFSRPHLAPLLQGRLLTNLKEHQCLRRKLSPFCWVAATNFEAIMCGRCSFSVWLTFG